MRAFANLSVLLFSVAGFYAANPPTSGVISEEQPQFGSQVSENPPFIVPEPPQEPEPRSYGYGYGYPGYYNNRYGYSRPGYGYGYPVGYGKRSVLASRPSGSSGPKRPGRDADPSQSAGGSVPERKVDPVARQPFPQLPSGSEPVQFQSQVSENPPFIVAGEDAEPRSYYRPGYGYYRPGYGYNRPGYYYGYGKRSVYASRPSGSSGPKRPGRDAPASQSKVSENPPFIVADQDSAQQPEPRIYDPYYRCRYPRACPRIVKRDVELPSDGSADAEKPQFQSQVSENPPFFIADGVQEPEPRSYGYGYGYPGYYNNGYGYNRPGYGYGYPGGYYGYGKRSVLASRPSGSSGPKRPGRDVEPQSSGGDSGSEKPQFQSQVSENPPFIVADSPQDAEPRSYYYRPSYGYYRPGYGYYRPGYYYG